MPDLERAALGIGLVKVHDDNGVIDRAVVYSRYPEQWPAFRGHGFGLRSRAMPAGTIMIVWSRAPDGVGDAQFWNEVPGQRHVLFEGAEVFGDAEEVCRLLTACGLSYRQNQSVQLAKRRPWPSAVGIASSLDPPPRSRSAHTCG